MIQRAAILLAALILFAAVFVWWVLESSGVAIAKTRRPDGSLRETHVWFVHADDGIWLEAGRPRHPWYLDIQRDPWLGLQTEEFEREFEAVSVPGRKGHERIRALLLAKYGLRDRILGYLIDTSQSIAVRLEPLGEGQRSGEPGVAIPGGSGARTVGQPASGLQPTPD